MDLSFWKKERSEPQDQSEQEVQYQYAGEDREADRLAEVVVESPEYYQSESANPAKAKIYNYISRWALYIGVFLLPLFFLPFTSSPLELNKMMLLVIIAGIGLVSWLLGIISSGYLAWRNNLLDKGVLALLLASSLATIFSIDQFKSIFGFDLSMSSSLTVITALTIIYFLIVNNLEDRGRTLRSIVGLSIIVALVYGILQMFGVHVLRLSFISSRAFNTVGSINVLGILSAVSLPLFSKSLLELGWVKNLHLEKVGVALALAILLLLNWWVLWAVAISGMVAMIVFENFGGAKFRITRLLLPMMVVVLGVFAMIINFNLSILKDKLPVEITPSFNLSKDVAVSALKENMVFGYGPENFSIAFDKYGAGRLADSTLSNTRFLDATSEFITLIVQGGLVMAVVLIFLLFCLGLTLWRFSGQVYSEFTKENTGVLASMIALVTGFFLYPFNMTIMSLLYVFMGLTVLIIYDKNRREFNVEEKTSLSLVSSLGFIGGLILVLVGAYFSSFVFISDVKYAQALSEKDNTKIAEFIVEAINWNGQDDRYYRTASQIALQLLVSEINKPNDLDKNTRIQNYVTTSISLAKRATEIGPRESLNWINLGFVYANLLNVVDGVDKLSEDAYLKAAELRPGDPTFNYRIGLLYMAKLDLLAQLVSAGRIDQGQANKISSETLVKAEDNLKKSVELSPNFGLAIYNLGVIYDRQGKISDAIKQLEKIIPANPNQPGLTFELGLLYYRAGRKNEALNQLQRAVILAPEYSNARWYLALIHEERGNIDVAIDQLEKILSVDVNKNNTLIVTKLGELRAGKFRIPPGDVLDQKPIE